MFMSHLVWKQAPAERITVSLPKFSVDNYVLVNILMVVLLLTGAAFAMTMVREMFPESRPDQIIISVIYPATQPDELEKAITIKIEEAVSDISSIEKVSSTVSEGVSTTFLTLYNEVDDLDSVLQEVKNEVDAIEDLPEDAEEPLVRKLEPVLPVIQLALYGDGTPADRKKAARDLRDELLRLPGISDIDLGGVLDDEISVEVFPEKLRQYDITFEEVSSAIRRINLDISGGTLKGETSNTSVKTLGESLDAKDLEDIVIRSENSGKEVRVKDVAKVIDGFVDIDVESYFNGKPSISLVVQKTSQQDAIRIANMVTAYVRGKQGAAYDPYGFKEASEAKGISYLTSNFSAYLGWFTQRLAKEPDFQEIYDKSRLTPFRHQFKVDLFSDLSRFIRGRLDLMIRNGQSGLILVLIALNLFLNWRVAFWVSIGMPTSFLGAFIIMWIFGVSINLLSMFGLIIVMGIIVDDAIIIGENIFRKIENGDNSEKAAVEGAEQVMWPVIVAVGTNIASFAPLMFIQGRIGDFMRELPIVVTACLFVSLIEAIIILPSHLSHLPKHKKPAEQKVKRRGFFSRISSGWGSISSFFNTWFLHGVYHRFVTLALHYRYVTVSVAIATLLGSLGLFLGGFVESVFIQKMDSETVIAELEMPVGTPVDETRNRLFELSEYAMKQPEVKSVQMQVGTKLNIGGAGSFVGETKTHIGQIVLELIEADKREQEKMRSSEKLLAELRAYSDKLKGVNSLSWEAFSGGPAGKDIEIRVSGNEFEDLITASTEIKKKLAGFDGVVDLKDNYEAGKRELQFKLKETARALGITESDLGTFIRHALFGSEALRITRNREVVKIMVRYPEVYRQNIHNLEQMWVPVPNAMANENSTNNTTTVMSPNTGNSAPTSGRWAPIEELSFWEESRGFTSLHRSQQQRSITVTGDVDYTRNNLEKVMKQFREKAEPILREKYPEMRIDYLGTSEERTKSFSGLFSALPASMLIIYMMLAGLFKSYWQPVVVMMAIPFGLEGAIVGHLVTDNPMTILSWIGLVALTGILVNDSLVLIEFVNLEIKEGVSVFKAHVDAAKLRFRAILLTTTTTSAGLLPIMFEKSFQAKFLIPMAVTLTFGLIFATILTLIVVPALNLICYDIGYMFKSFWEGKRYNIEGEVVE